MIAKGDCCKHAQSKVQRGYRRMGGDEMSSRDPVFLSGMKEGCTYMGKLINHHFKGHMIPQWNWVNKCLIHSDKIYLNSKGTYAMDRVCCYSITVIEKVHLDLPYNLTKKQCPPLHKRPIMQLCLGAVATLIWLMFEQLPHALLDVASVSSLLYSFRFGILVASFFGAFHFDTVHWFLYSWRLGRLG